MVHLLSFFRSFEAREASDQHAHTLHFITAPPPGRGAMAPRPGSIGRKDQSAASTTTPAAARLKEALARFKSAPPSWARDVAQHLPVCKLVESCGARASDAAKDAAGLRGPLRAELVGAVGAAAARDLAAAVRRCRLKTSV